MAKKTICKRFKVTVVRSTYEALRKSAFAFATLRLGKDCNLDLVLFAGGNRSADILRFSQTTFEQNAVIA